MLYARLGSSGSSGSSGISGKPGIAGSDGRERDGRSGNVHRDIRGEGQVWEGELAQLKLSWLLYLEHSRCQPQRSQECSEG